MNICEDGLVSIHALLAECDCLRFRMHLGLDVSIHALLAECDFKIAEE